MKTHLLFALALAGTAAAVPAQASISYFTNYDVESIYTVDNIAIFERWSNGGSITNSFHVPDGTSTITNPFLQTNSLESAFLLGVAYDLPGDPAGQKHLVVFANDNWALGAQGIAFGTLFPSTLEANLITALENIGGASTDEGVIDWSYEVLGSFSSGEADSGPGGSIAFAWTDSFSLVAFSEGTLIGSGKSYATFAAPVPEPASWAMMIAGLGLVGATMRRRAGRVSISFA